MARHEITAPLFVAPSELKMLRENLCFAQAVVKSPESKKRLQRLINQIDIYRPLGPDGKHGDRHTVRCGCEDK